MAGELIVPMDRFDSFPPVILVWTATADVARGDVVKTPAGPAFTLGAAKKDEKVEVVLKCHRASVPKPNTQAWVAGTRAIVGDMDVGIVYEDAARADTRAEVLWGENTPDRRNHILDIALADVAKRALTPVWTSDFFEVPANLNAAVINEGKWSLDTTNDTIVIPETRLYAMTASLLLDTDQNHNAQAGRNTIFVRFAVRRGGAVSPFGDLGSVYHRGVTDATKAVVEHSGFYPLVKGDGLLLQIRGEKASLQYKVVGAQSGIHLISI